MTEPINLLFITTYVGLGGGETSLLTLVEALVARESAYQPHLLVPHDGQLADRWRAQRLDRPRRSLARRDDLFRPGDLGALPDHRADRLA